jgi:uncharacterized membrane protein required for colicin V production
MQYFSSILQNACAVTWTNYILDGIALLFIIGYAIVCARKGFIECFFSFVTVSISIVLAFAFAKLALSITGGWFGMQASLTKSFTKSFEDVEAFTIAVDKNGLEAALSQHDLPKFLVNLAVKWFGSETLPEGTTIAMVLGQVTARLLSLLISGAFVFVISLVGLFFLKKILSAFIKSIKILGLVNGLLGACVGLFQSVLIISTILGVVALIPSATVEGYLTNSLFLGVLYENNLLIKCFGLML